MAFAYDLGALFLDPNNFIKILLTLLTVYIYFTESFHLYLQFFAVNWHPVCQLNAMQNHGDIATISNCIVCVIAFMEQLDKVKQENKLLKKEYKKKVQKTVIHH